MSDKNISCLHRHRRVAIGGPVDGSILFGCGICGPPRITGGSATSLSQSPTPAMLDLGPSLSVTERNLTLGNSVGNVCFTPESGHVQCTTSCLLWANSGHICRSM